MNSVMLPGLGVTIVCAFFFFLGIAVVQPKAYLPPATMSWVGVPKYLPSPFKGRGPGNLISVQVTTEFFNGAYRQTVYVTGEPVASSMNAAAE